MDEPMVEFDVELSREDFWVLRLNTRRWDHNTPTSTIELAIMLAISGENGPLEELLGRCATATVEQVRRLSRRLAPARAVAEAGGPERWVALEFSEQRQILERLGISTEAVTVGTARNSEPASAAVRSVLIDAGKLQS